MKIEYRILWLDDKIDEFIEDELIDDLKRFLEENDFKPEIITTDNEEDFFTKLNDNFDLILTDYHLNGRNGDKIVEAIRGESVQTEILFYTARADLKDTNKISRVSFLETSKKQGNHSDIVLSEAKNLINLTIRKFHHIVAMRGMIMHETSTLDLEMLNILNSFIENINNEEVVKSIGAEILEEVREQFSTKLKSIEELIPKNNNLKKLSKDSFVYSAHYKIMTMGRILQYFGLDDFSTEYAKNINGMRNTFAHASLETDHDTGRKYFKKGDVTFNEDLCREIRKHIIKSKEDLNQLAERLRS